MLEIGLGTDNRFVILGKMIYITWKLLHKLPTISL